MTIAFRAPIVLQDQTSTAIKADMKASQHSKSSEWSAAHKTTGEKKIRLGHVMLWCLIKFKITFDVHNWLTPAGILDLDINGKQELPLICADKRNAVHNNLFLSINRCGHFMHIAHVPTSSCIALSRHAKIQELFIGDHGMLEWMASCSLSTLPDYSLHGITEHLTVWPCATHHSWIDCCLRLCGVEHRWCLMVVAWSIAFYYCRYDRSETWHCSALKCSPLT